MKPCQLDVAKKVISSVQEMQPPRNKTQLRSFLGMCNVYRRFVKDFATIASPLNRLLRKTEADNFELDEKALKSYEILRERLASPAVLNVPRLDLTYVLDTDADANQVGCVLMQKHKANSLRPIGYFSKTLTKTERNYDTTEREALRIIWAVLLLRPYLESTNFTLRTDHGALKWIFGSTQKSGKLARWRLRLQEFYFEAVSYTHLTLPTIYSV